MFCVRTGEAIDSVVDVNTHKSSDDAFISLSFYGFNPESLAYVLVNESRQGLHVVVESGDGSFRAIAPKGVMSQKFLAHLMTQSTFNDVMTTSEQIVSPMV